MARRIASVDVPVPVPRPPRPRPSRPDRPALAVVHDADGPRVRLGLIWFGAALLGMGLGQPALALLMAVAAALAAGQLVIVRAAAAGESDAGAVEPPPRDLLRFATWLTPPMRMPAALVAFALPLAAAAGTATLSAAIAMAVPVVAVYRLTVPGRGGSPIDTGAALAYGWALGLAGATPVLAYGVGADIALVMIVLVSAYDAGDFIVGTGATSPWEGPAAGIAAVLVLTFAATVAPPSPLDAGDVWLLGALACLLTPIGPPAASVLLGDGRVRAGFVRRLDSLLVVGPVWVYAAAAVA